MKYRDAISALILCLGFTIAGPVPQGHAETNLDGQVSREEQREGRWKMVTSATMYGFYLYGPGTARLLDIDSAQQIVGLEMLIGGGSFFYSLKATRNYRLGAGRTQLILGGSLAGTLYGFGLPVFFEEEDDRPYLAAAMIATPAGGLLAHRLSAHRWFEKGESDLIVNGGLVGALYGVAIPYLADIEDSREWAQAKIYVASAMAGVPAGVWATTKLIRGRPINQGRAHLLSLGAVVGASYASGILSLADVEAPRAHVLAVMLGLPAGTCFSYRWTGAEEYPIKRARLISLGALVGSLFGSGVALVAEAEDHKPYVLANIIGSAAGIWYAHGFSRDSEGTSAAGNSRSSIADRITVSLPSLGHWFTMGGLMMLDQRSPGGGTPVELVRVSF